MASQSVINATIDAYMAAFAADDRAAYLDCFAEDAWLEDPVGTPRREGREAIGAFWDEAHALPDSLELRPLGLRIVIGHEATFAFQACAGLGGETYALDVIDHLTFDDEGKITTLRAFFDAATMTPVAADPVTADPIAPEATPG
jgi:steroid delta-isomerase